MAVWDILSSRHYAWWWHFVFLTSLTSSVESYKIGVGIADITGPSVEISFMGYAKMDQVGQGIHLRQFARTFIIDDGQQRLAFVSADCGMGAHGVRVEVLKVLQKIYGNLYNEQNVMLSGTHTHSTPGGFLMDLLFDINSLGHSTKGTQWTHPRTGRKKVVSGDLPFGWEKVIEGDGKILYVDHENRRTTYTDPRLAFATEEKEFPMDIRQRFDGSSSALQVLHGRDLTGKLCVITGANCGIGFETSRALALHGCHIIFACRSLEKAEEAITRLKTERPQVTCSAMEIDLQSLTSVKRFADKFKETYKSLDILILNAGVFGLPYTTTEDGYEATFQVNHLSHFYLTLLLEEPLTRASLSRVVVVSSESHRFSSMTMDNISESLLSPSAENYWSFMAYNHSKLCNLLLVCDLARLWANKNIAAFALHPGNMVSTNISRNWWLYRILFAFVRPFTKSLEQASSTTVYCASAKELEGVTGLYFNNCCQCAPSKVAQDALADKLWKICTSMITSKISDHGIPTTYL